LTTDVAASTAFQKDRCDIGRKADACILSGQHGREETGQADECQTDK